MRPRLSITRFSNLQQLRSPVRIVSKTQIRTQCPRLPLLFSSTYTSPPPLRQSRTTLLTTEQWKWIRNEIRLAGKITFYLWVFAALSLSVAFGLQEDWLERQYPTPEEWSFLTKVCYHRAKWSEDPNEQQKVDWVDVWWYYQYLPKRLEDAAIDGGRLQEQNEGGTLVEGVGKTGFDISAKSESWRRAYHDVLMGAARTAEHLDSWVRDRTRPNVFPADMMIGPSNPRPTPVPPGSAAAPKEVDCDPVTPPPETYYLRILTTKGFTDRQRVEAGLAYASWLEYKEAHEAALEMNNWCMDIALASYGDQDIVDKDTGILKPGTGQVSSNMLDVLTARALQNARQGDISAALPMLLSILRARKTLVNPPAVHDARQSTGVEPNHWLSQIKAYLPAFFTPPKTSPAPSDGNSSPYRDSTEICEEAGLMAHIGEILYASASNQSGRENGFAWTREAVDIAEEELRHRASDIQSKKKCQECLESGFTNWATMASRLATEEKQKREKKPSETWFGVVKDDNNSQNTIRRWESEERVVIERRRRARDVLDVPIEKGKGSSFIYV